MGNDPGRKLRSGQTTDVVIKVKGPLTQKDARAVKAELDTLIRKYRRLAGGMTRPLKKAKRASPPPPQA